MALIAPSVLSADFSRLAEEIKAVERAGADLIHYDVMDGQFVPNISFGYKIMSDLKKTTDLFLDVHLMVFEPSYLYKDFVSRGAGRISFHLEAVSDVIENINIIKSLGAEAGITINPNTEVDRIIDYLPLLNNVLLMSVFPGFGGQKFIESTYDKIKFLNEYRNKNNLNYIITVDGGVNANNAHKLANLGCDVLVAGSSIFGKEDYNRAIKELRL